MPDWLQEALSFRHSTRAVIVVGLEDGRFAVLDEQLGPTKRNYLVCESLSDVEKELTGLRDRSLPAEAAACEPRVHQCAPARVRPAAMNPYQKVAKTILAAIAGMEGEEREKVLAIILAQAATKAQDAYARPHRQAHHSPDLRPLSG
jgi:hypothetical protein